MIEQLSAANIVSQVKGDNKKSSQDEQMLSSNSNDNKSAQENDSFKRTLDKTNRNVSSEPARSERFDSYKEINVDEKKITNEKIDPVASRKASQSLNSESLIDSKFEERDLLDKASNVADPLAQRIAVQGFIHKMEKDLGVQPEELITAFSKMSPEDLIKPPEESVKGFISQLGLNGDQEAMARAHYEQMLENTASSSMAEHLKQTGQELSIEVLSKDQMRKRQLNENVSKMSSSFFAGSGSNLTQETSSQQLASEGFQISQNTASSQESLPDLFNFKGLGKEEAVLEAPTQEAMVTPSSELEGMALPEEMTRQEPKTIEEALANLVESSQEAEESLMSASSSSDVSANELGMDEFNFDDLIKSSQEKLDINVDEAVEAQPMQSRSTQAVSVEPEVALAGNQKAMEQNTEGGDTSSQQNNYSQYLGQNSQVNTKETSQVREAFSIQTPQPTETEGSENVRQVINQAKFLATKGGGEMKLQLNPHGLGEVSMKVAVENGQVQVEMVADTNEAKKVIEKGLGELKAMLASQKLNVDQIKVDTSQGLSADLRDQQDQADRQFAQQFLNDFRQGNQNWRRSFYGLEGPQFNKSQIEDRADNEVNQSVLAANNNKKSNKRLDLVA